MKAFRTIIIFYSIIFITGNSHAQSWQWAKWSGGSLDDKTYSIATDLNGSVFMAGFYNSPTITFDTITLNNSGTDIFLVKYDYDGNAQWAVSSYGAGVKEATCVSTDAGGNILVTGYFKDTTITFGTNVLHNYGTSDMFIVKYDPNGNVIWAENSESPGSNAIATSVTVDDQDNIYVVGYYNGIYHTFGADTLYNNCVTGGTYDMFIVKYDVSGNMIWARRDGGSQNDFPFSVAVDRNNSNAIYMTGEFSSPQIWFDNIHVVNAVTSSPYKSDLFLVKYNSAGNVLWAKKEGGASWEAGRDITVDELGNIYMTGVFESNSVSFGPSLLILTGVPDLFLAKFDQNGNELWAKSGTGTGIEWGLSVITDATGNPYMAGFFSSSIAIFDGIVLNNSGVGSTSDMFVAKYNPAGNIQWMKSASGGSIETAYSLVMDEYGAVYVGGYYIGAPVTFDTITIPTSNHTNVFLAKLDTNFVTGNIPVLSADHISIFPNPFNESTTVKFFNPDNKEFILTITDIRGSVLRKEAGIRSNEILIERNDLKEGMYFIELMSENRIYTGKIIIE